MASLLENSSFESQIPTDLLITRIAQLHAKISKLESLRPSKQANSLFTQLVKLCTPFSLIEITNLTREEQQMRESLILLCGQAEGLLELEFAIFFSQNSKIPEQSQYISLL